MATRRDKTAGQTTASGKVTVTRVYGSKDAPGGIVEEQLEVQKFITDPAYVTVGAGTTKNLGDYESLRVDVRISLPCYAEEVDDVYDDVAEKVADRLEAEVNEYLNGGDE